MTKTEHLKGATSKANTQNTVVKAVSPGSKQDWHSCDRKRIIENIKLDSQRLHQTCISSAKASGNSEINLVSCSGCLCWSSVTH